MFDWDEANIRHIARHNITPDEAEYVLMNDPQHLATQIDQGEERLLEIGFTRAGRCLAIVFDVAWRSSARGNGIRRTPSAQIVFHGQHRENAMRMIVEGVPKFATEREEAEWWDANPDLMTELFLRAEAEGRFERGSDANGSSPKPTPRVALTADDLARSKSPARAKRTDRAA